MEHASKIHLVLLVLACTFGVYYVLPGTGDVLDLAPDNVDEVRTLPDFCKLTTTYQTCTSAYGLLTLLRDNCGSGRKEEKSDSVADEPTVEIEEANQKEEKEKSTEEKKREKNEIKDEKKSNLIYEVIIVLLLVSVTLSLADCFQERKRRRIRSSNSKGPEVSTMRGSRLEMCSRRLSLADLTMSRHARRESQASYRPPAGQNRLTLGRRSSSQEMPQNKNQVTRQTSCPQPFLKRLSTVDLNQDIPEDGGWAERRRVRMIQRH